MQTSYRRDPVLPSGAGRKLGYADWSVLLLSLLQARWHLSQEQVVGWVLRYYVDNLRVFRFGQYRESVHRAQD